MMENSMKTPWQHVKSRFKRSNIYRIFANAPTREETDFFVNRCAIVSALLVGLPFTFSGSFSTTWFDSYDETFKNCTGTGSAKLAKEGNDIREILITRIVGTVIPSVFTLVIAQWYFICRPFLDEPNRDNDYVAFKDWWILGKFPILLITAGISGAGFAAWNLLMISLDFYMVPHDQICNMKRDEILGCSLNYHDMTSLIFWTICLPCLLIMMYA